jgi:cell division protein FtsQ
MVALAGAGALGVAAWAALASPLARVSTLDVQGVTARTAVGVRAALAGEAGRPALLVNAADVAARIRSVPGVLDAAVGVRWPSTLTVRVVERVPAVALRVDGGVRVFDVAGGDLGTARAVPPGVPVVVVEPDALTAPTVLAALRVWRELPPGLAAQVAQIGATSPEGVWLRLRDRTRVAWGAAEDAARKAAAVTGLRRTVPAGRDATIDVSAAGAPAVSW